MSKSLVIVESPGKIAKISKILGDKYIVMASVGHIRNLDPKNLSIDIEMPSHDEGVSITGFLKENILQQSVLLYALCTRRY